MKILIIGEQNSGKTELRTGLAIYKSYSTSNFLFHRLSERLGIPEDELRRDKKKWTHALVTLGNELCEADPGVLVSICLFKARGCRDVVIDGVRRKNEFNKVRGMFDAIFYVEREGNTPHPDDNFELHEYRLDSDVTLVTNDSTIEDMCERVKVLLGFADKGV